MKPNKRAKSVQDETISVNSLLLPKVKKLLESLRQREKEKKE